MSELTAAVTEMHRHLGAHVNDHVPSVDTPDQKDPNPSGGKFIKGPRFSRADVAGVLGHHIARKVGR